MTKVTDLCGFFSRPNWAGVFCSQWPAKDLSCVLKNVQ